ncbi:MAG: hypothetical protein RJA44_2668 [Pseudomonadota bacterium]
MPPADPPAVPPDSAQQQRRKFWLACVLALVLPLLTLLLRMELPVSFGQRPLLVLFTPGLLLVAMLGGLVPGLLATACTGLITAFVLIPPIGSPWLAQGHDLFQWVMLLLSGVLAGVLAQWQRREHLYAIERQQALAAANLRLEQQSAREAHLQALFDSVPDAILISDPQGRIVQLNQRAVGFFGYSPEQLIGQPIDLLVPERARARHAGHRERYMAQPMARQMGAASDLSVRLQDGSEVPVSVSLNSLRLDAQTFVISAVRDTSALRQAEAELRRSRTRLEVATNAGQIGIWDYDVRADTLHWDDWMLRIYGIERAQFSGRYEDWTSRVHPDDLDRAVAAFRPVLSGEGRYDASFRIRRPDGQLRWLKVNGSAILDESGAVSRVIGTNIDISNEIQTRSELEEALSSLADRNRALSLSNKELDAFSYSVSHDLRAPLRSVDGFSKILLRSHAERLDESGRELLERMQAAARRMGQLIDDMLILSRISRAELKAEDFDISALAREVAEGLREAYPERQVELIVPDGLRARGDPKLVRIVLDNLLGNAWKFTSQTGHAVVEFGCSQDEQHGLRYFVRDNGAGFDMAYADKLFGAFQRLHSAVEFPGSGIGLATVARVIHRHGGSTQAEGRVGQGATIWFSLQP